MPDAISWTLLLAVGPVLAQASSPIAPGDQVGFSGTELAVIGGLLATIAGAVSLLFRYLLAAKAELITLQAAELGALRARLTATIADRAAIEGQLVDAFRSALKRNDEAIQTLIGRLDVIEQHNQRRHEEFVAMMRAAQGTNAPSRKRSTEP